jgi:hypothetical protein
MSELFKSKVGILLAGIHLLIVLPCLLYLVLIDKSAVLPVLILMILTVPWWLFVLFLPARLGIEPGSPTSDLIFDIGLAVGGLINAFILYLLGFLLTKAFNYLSSRK